PCGVAAALIVPPVLAPSLDAPVTRPELRECFGCGLFQIVPALGPEMRADCVRCGTALRRTRRDPLDRGLALTAASLVLLAVLWTDLVLDPDAVWEAIERRGQTHAPMPEDRSLVFHAGAVACEACGLVATHEEAKHGPCLRCGTALHSRKPDSLTRTWALIVA